MPKITNELAIKEKMSKLMLLNHKDIKVELIQRVI